MSPKEGGAAIAEAPDPPWYGCEHDWERDQEKCVTGRRYASYRTGPRRPKRRPQSAVQPSTVYSSSFTDFSGLKNLNEPYPTIYDRQREKDFMVAVMGGDPRRALTTMQLRSQHGSTEAHHNFRNWTDQELELSKAVSPHIEEKKRAVQAAYRLAEWRNAAMRRSQSESRLDKRGHKEISQPRSLRDLVRSDHRSHRTHGCGSAHSATTDGANSFQSGVTEAFGTQHGHVPVLSVPKQEGKPDVSGRVNAPVVHTSGLPRRPRSALPAYGRSRSAATTKAEGGNRHQEDFTNGVGEAFRSPDRVATSGMSSGHKHGVQEQPMESQAVPLSVVPDLKNLVLSTKPKNHGPGSDCTTAVPSMRSAETVGKNSGTSAPKNNAGTPPAAAQGTTVDAAVKMASLRRRPNSAGAVRTQAPAVISAPRQAAYVPRSLCAATIRNLSLPGPAMIIKGSPASVHSAGTEASGARSAATVSASAPRRRPASAVARLGAVTGGSSPGT